MEIGLLLMGLIHFVQTYHGSFFHLLQNPRCTNKNKIHQSCGRSHSHGRVVKSGTRLYLNCKRIITEATTTTTKSKQSRTQKNNYYEVTETFGMYVFLYKLALVGGITSGAWRNDFMYHSEMVNKFN